MKEKKLLSIIIPVLNESEINDTLAKLSSIDPEINKEIIVSDGSQSGTTINLINKKYSDIKTVISKPGRGIQMNTGAEAASGDQLLFIHADTFLTTGAFIEILKVMENGHVFAGAFSLKIDSRKKRYRIIEFFANIRSRLFRLPFGDQGLFIRKNDFIKLGRFSDIPIMEDADIANRIKKARRRIKILKLNAYTSSRRWEKYGIIYTTLKNWKMQMKFLAGTPPEELYKIYYEDKR